VGVNLIDVSECLNDTNSDMNDRLHMHGNNADNVTNTRGENNDVTSGVGDREMPTHIATSAGLPTQAVPFLEPATSAFSLPSVDPLWGGRPADYRSSDASMSFLSEGCNTKDIDLDDLVVSD